MKTFVTVFGIFINDFPYFMLAMLIMWDNVRYSRKHAFGVVVMLTLLHMTTITLLLTFASAEFVSVIKLPHEIFYMLLDVAALVWCVKIRPTRLLFMAFFIKYFADMVTSLAGFIETNLFPDVSGSFSLQFNLVHLGLLCVVYPLMYFFIKRVLQPLYKIENNKVWRMLWLAPMLFCALEIILSQYSKQTLKTFQFIASAGILFLISIFVYILILETLRSSKENEQMSLNIELMNRQLDTQREYFSTITDRVDEAKKSNHDLRHHLVALQGLNNAGNTSTLNEYINNILSVIPSTDEIHICQNLAVNAVSVYYLGLAKKNGIDTDIKLDIPEHTGIIPPADLCIIIGNLFENAIDACGKMIDGDKFIRIRSKINGASLSISVANSFDGVWHEKDGKYLSRKDSAGLREGVGVSSVYAICEKYNGLFNIAIADNEWTASAVVVLE